jgi:hypothetical protein
MVSMLQQGRGVALTDSAYRDASLGIRQHIADADQAISQRKSRMTVALWRLLPGDLRNRIDTLSAIAVPDEASFEALTKIADQRLLLVDALDEALRLVPELSLGLSDAEEGAPRPPAQDDTWGPIGTEEAIVPLRELARTIVTELDPAADVSVTGPRITVRLTLEDVPILWVVELGAPVQLNRGLAYTSTAVTFLRAKHLVEVNIPTELPRLRVRPEGLSDAVMKMLALEHEIELGDKTFDDACFVEGDDAFAPQLLDEATRTRLVERVKGGDFWLRLDGGVAALTWTRSGLTRIAGADTVASLRVVAALRHATAQVRLLRDA